MPTRDPNNRAAGWGGGGQDWDSDRHLHALGITVGVFMLIAAMVFVILGARNMPSKTAPRHTEVEVTTAADRVCGCIRRGWYIGSCYSANGLDGFPDRAFKDAVERRLTETCDVRRSGQ